MAGPYGPDCIIDIIKETIVTAHQRLSVVKKSFFYQRQVVCFLADRQVVLKIDNGFYLRRRYGATLWVSILLCRVEFLSLDWFDIDCGCLLMIIA